MAEPGKRTKWRDFLRQHWDLLAAPDFLSVEVWTARGLTTSYVMFVIELSTRQVEIAGIATHPSAAFMAQVARNLTDQEEGFFRETRAISDQSTSARRLLDLATSAWQSSRVASARRQKRTPSRC